MADGTVAEHARRADRAAAADWPGDERCQGEAAGIRAVNVLHQRGIPVTCVMFTDEGHGFVREEHRLAFSAVMEAFLARHLGGNVEPVGDAFTGSTIRFEAGRS
jgi:hypothetical protein